MNLLLRAIEFSKINKTCNSQDVLNHSVACLYSMLYPPKKTNHFIISWFPIVHYYWYFMNECLISASLHLKKNHVCLGTIDVECHATSYQPKFMRKRWLRSRACELCCLASVSNRPQKKITKNHTKKCLFIFYLSHHF